MHRHYYRDPFRDANYSLERVDAGRDYYITGPIHPVAYCRITEVGVPSMSDTFGPHLSCYEILNGPGRGLLVYTAEHYGVKSGVRVGDKFTSRDVIYEGRGSIEAGWGEMDNGEAYSVAWHSQNYDGVDQHRLGINFDHFMGALGVRDGQYSKLPRVGVVPPKYKGLAAKVRDGGWVRG